MHPGENVKDFSSLRKRRVFMLVAVDTTPLVTISVFHYFTTNPLSTFSSISISFLFTYTYTCKTHLHVHTCIYGQP